MRVYLAALTHNHKMVANEAMPLVPGYLKCYLEQELHGKIICTIFCYPDKLETALAENPPDMLMVSNYVWNEALSLHALAMARKHSPATITVMGGPNFSADPWKREAFLRANPQVDAIILGEAELAAILIAEELIRTQGARDALEEPSLSFLCRCDRNHVFHEGSQAPAMQDINSIPSPWLSGVLDEFFDGNLAPLLETTRGCSSRCLYCVQGAGSGQKVRQFASERIRDEIRYIAQRISELSPHQGYLAIADPEFGVHDKDMMVADCIQEQRQRYTWPRFIDATTGKNRQEAVLRTMSRLKDCLTMYNSVQTMNPAVAQTIRRRNQDAETLAATQRAADALGIRSLTETILGLPGEGYESHKQGMFDLLRAGFRHLVNYQCMILKGADLESDHIRSRFGLATMFRALPRCNGIYGGKPVIEVEEIVTSTPELPFEDYLKARQLHLVFFVFHAAGWFDPLFAYLRTKGLNSWDVLECLAEQASPANLATAEWLEGFRSETRGELFETADACREFYSDPAHFAQLQAGEIGGNLMFKYLALAVFRLWPELTGHLFDSVRCLLTLQLQEDTLLQDLQRYITHRIQHSFHFDDNDGDERIIFQYNIPAWVDGGFQGLPDSAGENGVFYFKTTLRHEHKQALKDAFVLFGPDLAGITKLVARTRRSDFEKDFFAMGET